MIALWIYLALGVAVVAFFAWDDFSEFLGHLAGVTLVTAVWPWMAVAHVSRIRRRRARNAARIVRNQSYSYYGLTDLNHVLQLRHRGLLDGKVDRWWNAEDLKESK